MDGPWRCFKASFLIIILCHLLPRIQAEDSSTTVMTSTAVSSTQTTMKTDDTSKSPLSSTTITEATSETTISTSSETTISSMPVTSPSTSGGTTSSWCRTSTECGVGGICFRMRCVCLPGYASNGTHCVKQSVAGDNCTITSECVKGADCNNSVCTCTKEFYATSDGQCTNRLNVSKSCEETKQCTVNAECQNNTCLCTEDFFHLNGLCKLRVAEGGPCDTGENKECVENAVCSKQICQCRSGFYSNGTNCIQKATHGGSCKNDTECSGSNSQCNDTRNVCTCKDGYFYSYALSMCRTVFKLKPQNITVKKYGSKSITVSWDPPVECSTSQCRYNVYYKIDGICKMNTTALNFIRLTGLQPGKNYTISVQTVYTVDGKTVESGKAEVKQKTMETQAENLMINDVTENSLVVSFDEPENETWDYFRLTISDTDRGTSQCVILSRHNSSDGLCGNERKCQQNVSLSNSVKHITYFVTGLEPYTNYNITIVMLTCPTESGPATETTRTLPAVPGPVLNLTATSDGRQVCANWSPPNLDPGPLEYHVVLVDNVKNESHYNTGTSEKSTCYDKLDKLFGFWEYIFEVTAFTSAGVGEKRRSNLFFTTQKAPVVDFKVFNSDGECCPRTSCSYSPHNDYKSFFITWSDPKPEKRGTRLTRYVIIVTNNTDGVEQRVTQNVSSELTGANDGKYRRTRSSSYNIWIHVIPGEGYSFKFETYDNRSKIYYKLKKPCKAPIGKPPAWGGRSRPQLAESTDTKLTIKFSHPLFYANDSRGQITESGVIVCRGSKRVTDASKITNTWGSNNGIYRIGNPGSLLASPDGLITLGAVGDCSDSGIRYCNGELEPETRYYVVVFVCSKRGCVQSPLLGPYTTMPVDNTVTIIVALISVALVVSVTVVIAAFLWKYRRSDHLPLQLSMRPKIDLSKIPRERPVQLSNMEAYVAELHLDSNRLFSMHYEDIIRISPKHPTHAANMDDNKQKNRWVNVLPFDDSRVKLSVVDEEETSDYINASYLPGYNWDKEYIASQGPLPGTVDDFWRMIWEQNISMIVMVTPIKENGKVKCEEYWPVDVQEPKQYGNIVVENISFSSLNTYNVTIFKLRMGDENDFRTVKHFHFLNWKDMSANVERSDVLNFVRTVRSYLRPDMEGPMVVHCSAGVGRTGTFILLDYLIQFIENHDLDETVDIYGFILKLRENRVLMVQTESQYVFIHDCASQLVEEKREAMDNISENELLYVNTEICPAQSEDDEDGNPIYENRENASTARLIQQTEL